MDFLLNILIHNITYICFLIQISQKYTNRWNHWNRNWNLVVHKFSMIFFCTENHINTSKRKFPLYSRQQKYNWLKFQLLKQKEQLSRSKFAKRIPWSQTQFQKSLRWLWKQIELFPWILWCACAFFLSTVEAEAQARWSNLKTGGDHILGRYFGTIFWDDILVPYFGPKLKVGWDHSQPSLYVPPGLKHSKKTSRKKEPSNFGKG